MIRIADGTNSPLYSCVYIWQAFEWKSEGQDLILFW